MASTKARSLQVQSCPMATFRLGSINKTSKNEYRLLLILKAHLPSASLKLNITSKFRMSRPIIFLTITDTLL